MNKLSIWHADFVGRTTPGAGSLPANLIGEKQDARKFHAVVRRFARYRPALVLAFLLAGFVGLHSLLPLATAIKIGADEDYELSKATLCNHGYKLYTEIWNDQPPLDTFIIANLLKHVSHSVLAPRLLTVGFAMVLLVATFVLIRAVSGVLAASLATAMLIGSPGFLELSCSAMQEVPALAPTVTALCLLWTGPRARLRLTEILAGALFGFALQMKLIGVAYLPISGLIIWLKSRQASSSRPVGSSWVGQFGQASLIFGTSAVITFVALNYLTGNSLLLQFQQSWAAHFAAAKSFEYGSPEERPYDWTVLLKNWETTAPALLGSYFLLRRVRRSPEAALPIAWLMLTLLVFGTHKPWWAYYYVHNALPLCWCAGVGIAVAWEQIRIRWIEGGGKKPQCRKKRHEPTLPRPTGILASLGLLSQNRCRALGVAVFGLCAASWMGTRIYLEEQAIRRSPKLYTCLVLKEIERFKPFTTFMFSDQPIFSFHADLPMPPHLAVISLKRFWTGDLNNARLVGELETLKPGLLLLGKKSEHLPYEELLNREYRLVYQDGANRLYAHQSIAKKPAL